MDYLMVYLDKNREKRAAIPDDEGIYYDSVEFEEYTEDMSAMEVVVLESEDFYHKVRDPDAEGKFFTCNFAGRYVSNMKVCDTIESIGFTTFFTSVIKEHIRE
ncbi:MAG: hypothetical protein EAX89_16525 [Candidatus Lokiarchaeota archaeon]|nr:hypothetical protein [Candidatus Lokiarchaeota archaeon]